MPLTRISLRRGKPHEHLAGLADGVYDALREVFDVPEGDRFAVIHQHDPQGFVYDLHYLGVPRSDDLVIIEITCNDTRTTKQKQALYRAVAENLSRRPGLRPEDVMIVLVEVKAENWSFGRGEAQYVKS